MSVSTINSFPRRCGTVPTQNRLRRLRRLPKSAGLADVLQEACSQTHTFAESTDFLHKQYSNIKPSSIPQDELGDEEEMVQSSVQRCEVV